MNLTLDQYIAGLERTARELPGVLSEWCDLDDELRDEYTDQLAWLLKVRPDVTSRAMQDGEGRWFELSQRIAAATSAMFHLRSEIADKMGIALDRIVPYSTYTATESGPTSMAV